MNDKVKNRYGRQPAQESEEERFVVVGKNPVLEAMRAEQAVDKLLVMKDNKDHVLGDIMDKARKRGILVQTVDRAKLDAISEGQCHQGVAALMAPFPYKSLEDVLTYAQSKGEEPLVVILDHLTDPHNLGAIIRSANLCGAHGIILPKRRSASLSPAAVKASSGAVAYIPAVKVNNLSQCMDTLKEKGFWIAAADMEGAPYYKNDFKGKMAIVIGNEGKGVSPKVKSQCDFTTSIPLYGDIDSFNASAAAAILLAEAARQRHQ
ncbi:23S rRNA (guanosine(2251)-2'-O)-methyltransferase RlmB [Eubacterium aggregans]|uniref:23S rRNA (guanosine(2251)-2'-O)-methyltransferase RlmB n=1 Tax=Eubacterium aggregans TaxID=81409 RepID=UPI003F3C50F8